MKLITETIEDIDILTEANAKGGKDYKIRGVFMQADIKNRNGRVYPVGTLQTEVARYTKEFIDKKRAFGELGHPDGPTVNLERVSHMITSLKPEGKMHMSWTRSVTGGWKSTNNTRGGWERRP